MSHPKLKLYYFDIAARAEVTRLLFILGGIPFEDVTIKREDWPAQKANMTFGQIPVLEVDGKPLAQSAAIERYAAKLAGLYPTDPWQAAKVDELLEFRREIHDLFAPTFRISDVEERKKARAEIAQGSLKAKLTKLQELLGSDDYFCGSSKPMYPDIAIYFYTSMLVSGFMDGLPTNMLDDYPALKAHHNRVASLPAVAKRYEAGDQNAAYKVLP